MFNVTVQKTVVDAATSEEQLYTYTASASTQDAAVQMACIYASMVEYGLLVDKWAPKGMAFPREQLYQFIQPATLDQIEAMYPDVVETAYMNALAFVHSYINNMFDVDSMLVSGDTSSSALTLRLALCIKTCTFILASSPQYSEVIEMQERQVGMLLKGLKSGQRSFGRNGIEADPNVRVTIVNPTAKSQRA